MPCCYDAHSVGAVMLARSHEGRATSACRYSWPSRRCRRSPGRPACGRWRIADDEGELASRAGVSPINASIEFEQRARRKSTTAPGASASKGNPPLAARQRGSRRCWRPPPSLGEHLLASSRSEHAESSGPRGAALRCRATAPGPLVSRCIRLGAASLRQGHRGDGAGGRVPDRTASFARIDAVFPPAVRTG